MLNSEVTSLPTIKISAEQDQDLVKQGYLTTKISQVGPWEGRSLQDVPYSIQIANSDLIKNLQANATKFPATPEYTFVLPLLNGELSTKCI